MRQVQRDEVVCEECERLRVCYRCATESGYTWLCGECLISKLGDKPQFWGICNYPDCNSVLLTIYRWPENDARLSAMKLYCLPHFKAVVLESDVEATKTRVGDQIEKALGPKVEAEQLSKVEKARHKKIMKIAGKKRKLSVQGVDEILDLFKREKYVN